MKLTDQEIIDARKNALANNPRSFENWAETINFGHEVENLVQSKYWRDYSKEKPHLEGYYAVIVRPYTAGVPVFVETLFWSSASAAFVEYPSDTNTNTYDNALFFKYIGELVEELGITIG